MFEAQPPLRKQTSAPQKEEKACLALDEAEQCRVGYFWFLVATDRHFERSHQAADWCAFADRGPVLDEGHRAALGEDVHFGRGGGHNREVELFGHRERRRAVVGCFDGQCYGGCGNFIGGLSGEDSG